MTKQQFEDVLLRTTKLFGESIKTFNISYSLRETNEFYVYLHLTPEGQKYASNLYYKSIGSQKYLMPNDESLYTRFLLIATQASLDKAYERFNMGKAPQVYSKLLARLLE